MRWFKTHIRGSLGTLLGNNPPTSDSLLDSATEDIRESMLGLLDSAQARDHGPLVRRIRYANDVQSLWYLRGDLMAAVAALRGETAAREKVASVTAQFRGLLPRGLDSRPSPLA
jgi:hypothetical protein